MEKAAIRSAPQTSSANPVARNAAARQAAGPQAADSKAGFSLLMADMAAPGPLSVTAEGSGEPALAGTDPSMPGTHPFLPGAYASLAATDPALALTDPALAAADPALAGADPSLAAANPSLVGLNGSLAALPRQDLTPVEAGIFSLASLVGQTARMDGAADAAQRDGRPVPAGEGLRRNVALPMGAALPAALPAPAWGAGGARDTAAADAGVPQSLADTCAITPESSTLALTPSDRGTPTHALAALLAQMEPEPQALAGTLASAGLPGLAAAGPALGNGAAPAVGSGAGEASAPIAAADASAVDAPAADAVLSLPDDTWADQLSEQVAFWVQQKTQRAEMTIDRQGQPVQVQVAITGNEAHVTFRSNEQQTRDMLDASTAQLREMLEQQGLTLAGVTVQSGNAGGEGASAQGDSSRQDPSGRQASRDNEGPPQIAQVSVDLRGRPQAGRTVDLFV
ncbi:MAG: flagellar hook-length control protein FliK [Comamonas sp.]